MPKQTFDVDFDVVLLGVPVTISFTRVTTWNWAHYGADADGRRGLLMTMIDDDYAEHVTVVDDAGDVRPGPDMWRAANEAVEQYLDSHEPCCDESEPDPDDREDEKDWWAV